MSELFLYVIKMLVSALKEVMTEANARKVIDKAFDKVEDMVADSSTHWDDVILIPILEKLREILSVPDNNKPG